MTVDELKRHLHYNPESGLFTWVSPTSFRVKKGSLAGKVCGAGYVYIGFKNKAFLAHRLAWFYIYGAWPAQQIDHINRIRTDNRLCNLREVSAQGNMQNASSRADNTSGFRGVVWRKDIKKWHAQIRLKGKNYGLGSYTNKDDAVAARAAAVKAIHPYATR